MKINKKLIISIIIILILLGVAAWYFFFYSKNTQNEVNEIIPEEEISNEQMRQTIVSLYYKNKDTKELMPEGRVIDSKELLENPYKKLVELLIEAPKNDKLESAIPEGTKVNNAKIEGDIVYLDLSKEFIENHAGGQEEESLTIYSIVNTLTELTEVNSIKILIDGKEDESFKDGKINFSEPFLKIN